MMRLRSSTLANSMLTRPFRAPSEIFTLVSSLSESEDGFTWGPIEVVTGLGAGDVAAPNVSYVNGRYLMWYTTGDGVTAVFVTEPVTVTAPAELVTKDFVSVPGLNSNNGKKTTACFWRSVELTVRPGTGF